MKSWLLIITAILFAFTSSCAGCERGCSSFGAENFGADWIIVQFDCSGKPFGCWTLENKSVTNEEHSDGIYWVSNNGHLVHISGFYNRVQVENKDWESAYQELGITPEQCGALRLK